MPEFDLNTLIDIRADGGRVSFDKLNQIIEFMNLNNDKEASFKNLVRMESILEYGNLDRVTEDQ